MDEAILERAFTSDAWRDAARALRAAFGVDVAVLDRRASATVDTCGKPHVCELLCPDLPGPSAVCPSVIHSEDGVMGGPCASGLSCLLVPIHVGEGDDPKAFVLVGGFVRERDGRGDLIARLGAKGLPGNEAKAVARDVPMLSEDRMTALRDIAVATATSLLEAERCRSECEREHRAALLVEELYGDIKMPSRDLTETRSLVLERAMGLVGAEVGSLLLHKSSSDLLELGAAAGAASAATVWRIGEGVVGRAAATMRPMMVTGGDSEELAMPGVESALGSWIAVPLVRDGRLMGVVCLGRLPDRPLLTAADLRAAEEYLGIASASLTGRAAFERLRDEALELAHVHEVCLALDYGGELDDGLQLLASILGKSFEADVSGLLFDACGPRRLYVSLRTDVSPDDLARLLSEATGEEDDGPPEDIRLVTQTVAAMSDEDRVADWSVLAKHLCFRDRTAGWLFLGSTTPGRFTCDDERLLGRLAVHASPSIERAALLARLRDDLAKMLTALSATIGVKERRERGERRDMTMDHAVTIGERMGLSRENVERLRFAGLVHDIGKVGVAEEILLKPSALTAEELESVRRHSEIGASIIEQLTFLHEVGPIILHHHERWDGNGYPMGLAGEHIPLLARVLAVADAFEAMTSTRAYRPALGYRRAREEIASGAGTQFDPEVVRVFLEILDERALEGATGLFADHGGERHELPA